MLTENSKKVTRVLHVVGGMSAGGLETLIMNIYRNIDRNKIQFDFAVQATKKCFYDEEIIEMGGRIITHPSPKKSLKNYKEALSNTLKNYGEYDVVHSHVLFFSGVVLEVAKKQNVPVRISHSHNTNDSKKASIYREVYRGIMRKKILKNSTHMIGCSREACEYVFGKSQFDLGIAKHFPNAIDITKYQELSRDKNDLKSELGLTKDTVLIGHIGRFSKQKNHLFLIEIFAEYLKNEKNAHLVLVGEGTEKENVIRLVLEKKIENRVHFLGLRKDIPDVLASIDLFLFPSLYEGLGIVAVEAQAAGVPCLVSDKVPLEADIDIGLVNRLNNDSDSIEMWVEKVSSLTRTTKLNWNNIETALKKSGYNIEESSERLIGMYKGKY